MKKTVKYVVSVLAIVSIIMTSLVLVTFAASPKITMTTGTTSNGQTEVIISVSKGADLATFQATVEYESDKVQLMSVEYLSGDKNVSNTETAGYAYINDIWLESLNDKADIVRLVFNVPADTKTTFTINDLTATDSNDEPIDFKLPVSATAKVKATPADGSSDQGGTTPASTPSGDNSGSGISGGTNGTSPNTGRMIASAAGVCGAAVAAAAVVIVLKKKNGKAE